VLSDTALARLLLWVVLLSLRQEHHPTSEEG